MSTQHASDTNAHQASDRLRRLRPDGLVEADFGGAAGLGIHESYGAGAFPLTIDAVLIDGPPHWTKRGREACLYQVASRVRIGGRVYLDDDARHMEQRIARNWLTSYPDPFSVRELRIGHRLCILQKRREVAPALTWPASLAFDAWRMHMACTTQRRSQRFRAMGPARQSIHALAPSGWEEG